MIHYNFVDLISLKTVKMSSLDKSKAVSRRIHVRGRNGCMTTVAVYMWKAMKLVTVVDYDYSIGGACRVLGSRHRK